MRNRNQMRQVKTNQAAMPNIMPFDLPGLDDTNGNIESDHHLLISKVEPLEMVPVTDGEGTIIPDMFHQLPEITTHKLYIGDFMEQGKGFYKIINRLQEADLNDVLELHVSSYGGAVSENIQLFNLINSMYSTRCTTYLNHGYSAGAMTFMMGQNRIIYKHSDIMFHFFSGGEFGKGSDMIASLNHSIKSISAYYTTILKDFFSPGDLELMIHHGREFWMDSATMMNKGIATAIIIDGQYYEAVEYFEKYDEFGEIKREYIAAQEKIELAEIAAEEKMLKAAELKHAKEERKEILRLAKEIHDEDAKIVAEKEKVKADKLAKAALKSKPVKTKPVTKPKDK